ncbi:MAG: glycosyltransferase family 39 protein, partial [Pseudomonadota bacterium]
GWKAWFILFAITFTAAAPGVFNMPALDRDESRFAQASKQYIETGDYLTIRYQDEFRNKKPAGIHWLQSGATNIFGDEDKLEIWTYRVPSWIGASLSTLAVFWCGLVLIGRRPAFLGAALYGATVLITSEAHISKTDAVLVFFTTMSIGALARLYMGQTEHPKRTALIFWFFIGAGLLIKGPVTPMVAAYAGFGAWVWAKAAEGRGGDWWKPLLWWPGPLLAAIMFLPWLIAIQIATQGTFLEGAVGKDLGDKFAGASEGHAGWPLYNVTHTPAWFFPAVLLLLPGLVLVWNSLRGSSEAARRRGTDALFVIMALGALTAFLTWLLPGSLGNGAPSAYPALIILGFWWISTQEGWKTRWIVSDAQPLTHEQLALRFLVAWAGLTWLFFELMPTRLSHYVMPAYPALGLICGWVGLKLMDGARLPVSRWASLGVFLLGGILLLVATSPLAVRLLKEEAAGDFKTVEAAEALNQWGSALEFPIYFWIAGGVAMALTIGFFAYKRIGFAATFAIMTSLLLGWHARLHFIPQQVWFQPTASAALALEQVCGIPSETCADGRETPERIQAVGYAEPSYVMTFGTQNLHPPETVVELPTRTSAYPVVFLLNMEDEAALPASDTLLEQASAQGRCVVNSNPVFALNYSNGDPVNFVALRFEAKPCDTGGDG